MVVNLKAPPFAIKADFARGAVGAGAPQKVTSSRNN